MKVGDMFLTESDGYHFMHGEFITIVEINSSFVFYVYTSCATKCNRNIDDFVKGTIRISSLVKELL
jgi:hypothetical protein